MILLKVRKRTILLIIMKLKIRRALCPGCVRSGHDPLSHVPWLCCAVLFHWIFLDKDGSQGHWIPKVCSPADPWRIPADCRCGSRPMGHSKNVGFYPSICIWAVRERTKAANIPITCPNLWFHGPIFQHMHYFDRISIEFRQNFYRISIEFRQNFNRISIEFRQNFDRISIELQQNFDRISIEFRQNFDGRVTPQDGLVTPPVWGLCADLF